MPFGIVGGDRRTAQAACLIQRTSAAGLTYVNIQNLASFSLPALVASIPSWRGMMADPTKLSVEKALEKIRQRDEPKSKTSRLDEKTDALNEEIKRMRAQRLRLERQQGKRG